MAKVRFPVVEGNISDYPTKALCPWCKTNKVFEPHSFACLCGGALLSGKNKGDAGPSNKMSGFLDLSWHGAHPEEGGTGVNQDAWANLSLAKEVSGGQFAFYFCSTKCLRAFLNSCVDDLEAAIVGSE